LKLLLIVYVEIFPCIYIIPPRKTTETRVMPSPELCFCSSKFKNILYQYLIKNTFNTTIFLRFMFHFSYYVVKYYSLNNYILVSFLSRTHFFAHFPSRFFVHIPSLSFDRCNFLAFSPSYSLAFTRSFSFSRSFALAFILLFSLTRSFSLSCFHSFNFSWLSFLSIKPYDLMSHIWI